MARGKEAGAADKDGCQRSKRSAVSLTVGYLVCAITPENSEELKETVYITCAWLGRCSKVDIAATKWRPRERSIKEALAALGKMQATRRSLRL